MPENGLGRQNQPALEYIRLCDLNKEHEVHTFVLGLGEQFADHRPVTGPHLPEALQMNPHAGNHPGHSGYGLQNHCSVTIAFRKKAVGDEAKKRRLRSGETIRKTVCALLFLVATLALGQGCVLKNLIWLERWQLDEVAKPAAESSFDRTQVFAAGLIAAH